MTRSARDELLRARFEKGIALAAPLLDLVLALADRTSRIVGGEDPEQIPPEVRRDGGRANRRLPQRVSEHGPG